MKYTEIETKTFSEQIKIIESDGYNFDELYADYKSTNNILTRVRLISALIYLNYQTKGEIKSLKHELEKLQSDWGRYPYHFYSAI